VIDRRQVVVLAVDPEQALERLGVRRVERRLEHRLRVLRSHHAAHLPTPSNVRIANETQETPLVALATRWVC